MSRSKWKGPYSNLKNIENLNLISRNSKIIPKFLGLTFKIYNGKNFLELTVSENMIGYKFGEFVFTRGKFSFKKKKSKK